MKKKVKKTPQFVCNECGHFFYTDKEAWAAAWSGCPGCNGLDIDIFVGRVRKAKAK